MPASLFDMVIRHQIYVEGLKAGKADEFYSVIGDMTRELRSALSFVPFENLGDMNKTALMKLLVSLRKAVRAIFDPWLNSLLKWLRQYVRVETGLYASMIEVEPPPYAPIYTKAENEPIPGNGLFMLPFLKGFGTYALTRLERIVVMARANRVTKDELIRQFTGTKKRGYKDGLAWQLQHLSKAATSTVIQHLSTQTGFGVFVSKYRFYEWVSVLDSRTTEICSNRDGLRFEVGKGPLPPAHVNCRSTIVPVASRAGKTPDFDFAMWARQQPDEFVNDALDGKRSSRYEQSNPLTLIGFGGKGPIIRM